MIFYSKRFVSTVFLMVINNRVGVILRLEMASIIEHWIALNPAEKRVFLFFSGNNKHAPAASSTTFYVVFLAELSFSNK